MKYLIVLLFLFSCKKEQDMIPKHTNYKILNDGNSIVKGYPITTGYSVNLSQDLELPVSNFGIGGYSTTQLIQIGERIDTIQHSDTTYIVLLDEARNDIYYGLTGQQAYQNYKTYCSDRKLANPNVKLVLCIPTPSISVNNTEIANFRSLIKADFKSTSDSIVYINSQYADVLIDLQNDSIMGYPNCNLNILYYCDGIHLTELGNQHRAKLIERGLKLLLK